MPACPTLFDIGKELRKALKLIRKAETAPRRAWSVLIMGVCMFILPAHSYGEDNIDLQALVQETQKISQSQEELTFPW
jgi:hypothetical protein